MNAGRLTLYAILVCANVAPAFADSLAWLYGRVLDPSGAAIPDAAITVVDQESGFRRTAQSQLDGEFALGSLRPGLYTITARKEGFAIMRRFNVKLEQAQPARLDFLLPIGSLEEVITVEGTEPLLGESESALGTRAYHDDIERMPLNGRGVLGLVELTPGAIVVPATRGEAGQFTVDGQRPNTNSFLVDGVGANVGVSAGGQPAQVTGGALPAVTAYGSLDSLLPLEAIDEFRVRAADMAPEAARLPGAVVTLSSRSGSNEFHGSAAYRVRHEWLAANDWLANATGMGRAPLRLQDVSPSLGGPIRRERSFFFLAYERLALRGPYVWQQAVPTADSRQAAPDYMQPALALFPAPNGAFLGDGTAEWSGRNIRPSALNSGAARIDHAVTSRITLFGRYNDAPSSNQYGSTQVNRLDLRFQSLTLGLNARPTARFTMDFRANESQVRVDSTWSEAGGAPPQGCPLAAVSAHFNPASACPALVQLVIGGVGQVAVGSEGERRQRQFQATLPASLNLGSHGLRFGVDYRRMTLVRRDAGDALNLIAQDVSEVVEPSSLWIGRSPAVRRSAAAPESSAWVQDTWRLGSRLTVTPGLRWQLDPPPVPAVPIYLYFPSTGTFFTSSAPLWPRSSGNLAPRLGAALRLDRDGGTVLRAGAGVSYDSGLGVVTDLLNNGPLDAVQFYSGMHAPFSTVLSYGFMPDLRPAQVAHWDVSLDHALSRRDLISIGYVGATGRRLLRREVGGLGNTQTALFATTTNEGASDYEGLQLQYRRRLSRGLDVSASYAWSHSIDNDSSDAFLMWAGPGTSLAGDRGSSDFDLRHSFTAAATYEFAAPPPALRWLRGWALDGMVRARSGFPVTVLESDQYMGIPITNAFRPNLDLSQPVWIADPATPGGRRLNPQAFPMPAAGVQGDLGRNAIRGFGMGQADLAVRREFRLGERRAIQLRIEAFNFANHANFADPVKCLNSPMFGRSVSMLNLMLGTGSPGSGLAPLLQTGGPRSVQVGLRFRF
jgi:hypothetical protein